jgi:hypothetical protein
LLIFLHHRLGIDPGQLVGHHVAELAEPEIRHLVQHPSLVRDGIGQHHVESRQAVAGDDQHLVGAHGIDVAHLALADARQALDAGLEERGH